MKQRREYRINHRVVDRAAVERLARFIVEQATQARDAGMTAHPRFQVSCDDGTTYESDGLDVVEEGSEATLKNPITVSLELLVYSKKHVERERDIDLQLRHGDIDASRLRVSGDDAHWVQSVFMSLKERVDSCPPSGSWFTRHTGLTDLAFVVGIGSIAKVAIEVITAVAIDVFDWTVPAVQAHAAVKFAASWFFRLVLGALIWGRVQHLFWEAWPPLELAFGPAHLRLAEKRRQAVSYVFSGVVLPLVLTIAYEVLTSGNASSGAPPVLTPPDTGQPQVPPS